MDLKPHNLLRIGSRFMVADAKVERAVSGMTARWPETDRLYSKKSREGRDFMTTVRRREGTPSVFRSYDPSSGDGSTGFAFFRISKWSCGWFASPVTPAVAMV